MHFRDNKLAVLFSFPVLIYALAFPVFRLLGEAPLLIVCLSSFLSCWIAGFPMVQRQYLSFLAYSGVVLFLSLLNAMPQSWTVVHDSFAAIRQWFPFLILPILSTSFYILYSRYKGFVLKHAPILAISSFFVGGSAKFIAQLVNQNSGSSIVDNAIPPFSLYGLTNEVTVFFILYFIWIFRKRASHLLPLTLLATLFFLSSSAQSQVLSILVALMYLSPSERIISNTFAFAVVALVVLAPLYPYELYTLDENTGVRAVFWAHAQIAMFDTAGLGVGYGTEYIKNDFYAIMRDSWEVVDEYSQNRIYIGTHSTLYDVGMRTGIVGLVLFLRWYIFVFFPPNIARMSGMPPLFFATGVAALVINSINVGVASINYVFGTALCVAIAYEIKNSVQAQTLNRDINEQLEANAKHPELQNVSPTV